MAEHNQIGKNGEKFALELLQTKGFEVLATNWRYQKLEVDIIAKKNDQLVIVEVKTRSTAQYESPIAAVTLSKQKNLVKAANAYVEEHAIDLECRFDVIGLIWDGESIQVEHIENAFYPLL